MRKYSAEILVRALKNQTRSVFWRASLLLNQQLLLSNTVKESRLSRLLIQTFDNLMLATRTNRRALPYSLFPSWHLKWRLPKWLAFQKNESSSAWSQKLASTESLQHINIFSQWLSFQFSLLRRRISTANFQLIWIWDRITWVRMNWNCRWRHF